MKRPFFATAIARVLTILTCLAMVYIPSVNAQSDAANDTANNATEGVGSWEGALTLPSGSLRIVFHVAADDAGNLSSTMDSPDQGATGIPVTSTTFEAGKLTLNASAIGGTYIGTLSEDGQTLSGQWSQGGMSLDLDLTKTDKPTKPNRPQEPEGPFPYEEADVSFENKTDNVRLVGTLTIPKSAGPHPAVVLVSGSGPQDRDESIMGHKPFLVLSDHLTRQGIAVLRYDDRGTAESTGDFSAATTKDLANDAQAAVDFLKSRNDIDGSKIGVAGHSEGGLIAPILGVMPGNIAFIVMLAGPGLPGDEILRLQGGLMARAGGMSEPLIEKMLHVNSALYETAINAPEEEVENALKETISDLKTSFDASTIAALGLTAEREPQIIQQLSSPWFRYFLTYDPQPVLEQLQIPVLSVIGEKDLQVPAKENTEAIAMALKTAKNKNFSAKTLPDLNHLFQTANTGAVTEYAQIEETFAPAALVIISDWILEQTGD